MFPAASQPQPVPRVPLSRWPVRQGEDTGLVQRGTDHQDTAKAAAVSDTARPDQMTAFNYVVAELGSAPGTARDLGGRLKERQPDTVCFIAVSAVLGSGSWTTEPPRHRRRECPGSAGSAVPSAAPARRRRWGTRWLICLDNDLVVPFAQQADGHDAAAVQVKRHLPISLWSRRSNTSWARVCSQGIGLGVFEEPTGTESMSRLWTCRIVS